MTTTQLVLPLHRLTAEAFMPIGDVIEVRDSARHFGINQGWAERYHDLAKVDVGDGRVQLSVFRARPRRLPLKLSLLERHQRGSQTFLPMSVHPYLVVVAPPGPRPDLEQTRCFFAAPGQGVNYARGVWHHPLLALQTDSDFWVIDRGAADDKEIDCEEFVFDDEVWVEGPPRG
jgi:ureidoglycolate lyase